MPTLPPTTAASFAAARAICRRHAKSFYFASVFLPRHKREAAYAVYAFCRLLDDAADEGDATPAAVAERLGRFEAALEDVYAGRAVTTLADEEARQAIAAFALTVQRYDLPRAYFTELAEGCRMDLTVNRYATWDDLRQYCYRVAGVVGLIMSRVFGLDERAAERQAVMMGEAMQLTNILRDVREDLARGRIYLPGEDLARFGVSETDLATGIVTEPIRQLIQFEISRARQLYRDGAVGLVHLADDGSRFTAAAMGVIYAGILGAIERRGYDVFSGRARLSTMQKLRRLPAARRLSRGGKGDEVPDVF